MRASGGKGGLHAYRQQLVTVIDSNNPSDRRQIIGNLHCAQTEIVLPFIVIIVCDATLDFL